MMNRTMDMIHTGKRICWICASLIPWMVAVRAMALPPDPDNGALLYYQACFLYLDPAGHLLGGNVPRAFPDDALGVFDGVLRGAEPNDAVRKYLKHRQCRGAIELALAATHISDCDWGLMYSHGFPLTVDTLWSLSHLARLLEVHARTLASDGKYREALDACLNIRRFAGHIGDDTCVMYATSQQVDSGALRAIQYVVECMTPDQETLAWLRTQLGTVQGTPWHPERALISFRDMQLQFLSTHPEDLLGWKERALRLVKEEGVRKGIEGLTSEEAFQHARGSYDEFLGAALRILDSGLSCKETYAELKRLIAPLKEKANAGDPIGFLIDQIMSVDGYYRLHVDNLALYNAIMAATVIYRIKAETGQLPDVLPDDLARDPYGDKDFEYQKTEEGFLLRCSASPFGSQKIRRFEFKVHK